jgi:L-ascorbate 6-phosphate lactonase
MRRSQLSIAKFLVFTAVVDVGLSGLSFPTPEWTRAMLGLTQLILLYAVVAAIQGCNWLAWAGFAIFGWAYLGVHLGGLLDAESRRALPTFVLIDQLANWLPGPTSPYSVPLPPLRGPSMGPPLPLGPSEQLIQFRAVGHSLMALIFGSLGMAAASFLAWREDRREGLERAHRGEGKERAMMDMIQPVRRGQDLADEIRATQPAPGTLAIWWLGQSGYVIKSRQGTLVVDPYLSEHLTKKYANTNKPHTRMTAAPLRGSDLREIDLVLASHKHSDHLDPETAPAILAASPGAELALPNALVEHAVGLGIERDRLIGLDLGITLERAGFHVRAIPSAHEGLDTDARGRHLYLGFVIETEGLRLYHSGDGVVYDQLADRLGSSGQFNVFFLPINGRDPARGVPGNMSASEAVELASRCKPQFVVPHHYDMFTFNTVPVSVFEAEARRLPEGVNPRVLRCGERWEIHL